MKALIEGYELEGGGPDSDLRRELEGLSDQDLLALLAAEAPDVYARTDRTQRRRILRAVEIARSRAKSSRPTVPALNALLLGPYFPRSEVHQRIELRLDDRLQNGLVEEVRTLQAQGLSWERLDYLGLEYRYVTKYVMGELRRNDMLQ